MAKINTPHLSKMFADDEDSYVREMIKHGEKTLADDWENYEDTACEKCHGTGLAAPGDKDAPDGKCVACEGTGIWFRLYYGVSDGKPYAYTDEHGIEFLKKTCAEFRSAHTQMQLSGKTYNNIRPYLLPKTLEMELMARGLDPHSKDQDEKIRIMNIVAQEYPDFMCVNYTRF